MKLKFIGLGLIVVGLITFTQFKFKNVQKDVDLLGDLARDQTQVISRLIDLVERNVDSIEALNEATTLIHQRLERYKVERVIYAVVTAYNPVKSQTDDSPYTTAFLKNVNPKYVAVSRDILKKLKWVPESKIYIEGVGIRKIGDLMSPKVKGYHIDLFMWKVKDAKRWGKRKCLVIYLGD